MTNGTYKMAISNKLVIKCSNKVPVGHEEEAEQSFDLLPLLSTGLYQDVEQLSVVHIFKGGKVDSDCASDGR